VMVPVEQDAVRVMVPWPGVQVGADGLFGVTIFAVRTVLRTMCPFGFGMGAAEAGAAANAVAVARSPARRAPTTPRRRRLGCTGTEVFPFRPFLRVGVDMLHVDARRGQLALDERALERATTATDGTAGGFRGGQVRTGQGRGQWEATKAETRCVRIRLQSSFACAHGLLSRNYGSGLSFGSAISRNGRARAWVASDARSGTSPGRPVRGAR
jgi:hypothetical protein